MIRLSLATLCVICVVAQAEAAAPRYLQVAVSGYNNVDKPVCPVSLVYDISKEQLLNGAYFIADSSCGITADAAAYRPSGMKFEMAFNMRVQVGDQGTRLSGTTYALSYSGGERMGGGERASVEKALVLGRKTQVCSFGFQDSGEVQMYVTLLDQCPPNSTDCGENAVTLITSVTEHGKPFAHNLQTEKLLAEAMEFRAVMKADSGQLVINYSASVRIPGGMQALKGPTRCKVEFLRNYQIISGTKGNPSKPTVAGYASNNSQDVVLEPGKELRLVFPPDELSPKGIDIEDTLVIVPR